MTLRKDEVTPAKQDDILERQDDSTERRAPFGVVADGTLGRQGGCWEDS